MYMYGNCTYMYMYGDCISLSITDTWSWIGEINAAELSEWLAECNILELKERKVVTPSSIVTVFSLCI